MKTYYASQLGNKNQKLNEYFDKVLRREKVVAYVGFGAELDIEDKDGVIFVDDFGRGGGPGIGSGEIYEMMQYMFAIMIGGIVQGVTYDLFKKSYSFIKKVFRKSKKRERTLYYFVQLENNSQYHFVFFSFIDERDFEKAFKEIPNFIRRNKITSGKAVDCYFDTKLKKWHIVGERTLSKGCDGRYLIS